MTFSLDDYEKAIARIFDRQGQVIGTGFLVAPGYVLTCAHVVLQAIGIPKESFAKYEGQPQELLSLDFHVLASGQSIQANVVAWLPYSLEAGDVAALKLLTPEPTEAQPIPLVEVSRADVETDRHSVYGFGKGASGGRSDAYRPKANVAGGRFQLCKFDSEDETIKPGFSGAPVWNEARQCIIGMVATAVVTMDEKQSTAYAIPTKVLQPVLKQVEALYLDDVLEQSLEACSNADEQHQLTLAIDTALRSCNPNGGDCPWRDQLVALGTDRPPRADWETEGRLAHFATLLAQMSSTPAYTYGRLKTWVEQRCHLNFPSLLDRISLEMKQQKKVVPSGKCQHLMVVVEPVETAIHELRVSLLAVPDRDTYNPYEPLLPIAQEEGLSPQALPAFLQKTIRDRLHKKTTPTIHLFVPRDLFDCDFAMLPSSRLGDALGSKYPLVIRTNLTTHPIGRYYRDDWQEKWEQVEQAFENPICTTVKPIDCSLPEGELIAELKTIWAAMLEKCDCVSDLFELASEETVLPLALWSRDPQFQNHLTEVLDGIVRHLPDRIQQERATAFKSQIKPVLGHHLSLVWEDPKIVPPDMQFDPEAC
jgi:V8-like Glu-specific endopeptidase